MECTCKGGREDVSAFELATINRRGQKRLVSVCNAGSVPLSVLSMHFGSFFRLNFRKFNVLLLRIRSYYIHYRIYRF